MVLSFGAGICFVAEDSDVRLLRCWKDLDA